MGRENREGTVGREGKGRDGSGGDEIWPPKIYVWICQYPPVLTMFYQ
jgi:hypothetical protein